MVGLENRRIDYHNSSGDSDVSIYQTPFSIPALDSLLPNSSPTILELVSPPLTHHPSGAGKTSLLYLIVAQAILPRTINAIPDINGHSAAVILIDPLHHFSPARLLSVTLHLLVSKLGSPSTLHPGTKADLISLATRSLDHVHIFHPQSWASLIATLRSLPDYLFNATQHKSTHRRIHSLILEDVDAFAWSLRAANVSGSSSTTTNPLGAASRALTAEIQKLVALLGCNAVLTSASVLATAFRPALPAAWPGGVGVVRLAVRRVEVLKFAPEMGVEQAEGEKGQRWDVVRRARFECWKVGAGAGAGAREGPGEGFVFRVGMRGVEVEEEGAD